MKHLIITRLSLQGSKEKGLNIFIVTLKEIVKSFVVLKIIYLCFKKYVYSKRDIFILLFLMFETVIYAVCDLKSPYYSAGNIL